MAIEGQSCIQGSCEHRGGSLAHKGGSRAHKAGIFNTNSNSQCPGFPEVGFPSRFSLKIRSDFQARKGPFHGKSLEIAYRGGKSNTGGFKI